MQTKSKSGRVFHVPNDEEDARIRTGIAADPDAYEVSDEAFKQMRRPGRHFGVNISPSCDHKTS